MRRCAGCCIDWWLICAATIRLIDREKPTPRQYNFRTKIVGITQPGCQRAAKRCKSGNGLCSFVSQVTNTTRTPRASTGVVFSSRDNGWGIYRPHLRLPSLKRSITGMSLRSTSTNALRDVGRKPTGERSNRVRLTTQGRSLFTLAAIRVSWHLQPSGVSSVRYVDC